MRSTALLGVTGAVLVSLLSTPASATSPVQIIPVGKAVIQIDDGCLGRVVAGKYKMSVPANGKMVLPTGKYLLKARPGTCKVSRKKIRVRKGKIARAKVLNTNLPAPTPTV